MFQCAHIYAVKITLKQMSFTPFIHLVEVVIHETHIDNIGKSGFWRKEGEPLIAKALNRTILPAYERKEAILAEHPDWWCAFAHDSRNCVAIPDSVVRVAISSNKSMDAAEFSNLLSEAHRAEDATRCDTTLHATELAMMLSRSPVLLYEGVRLEAETIEPITHGDAVAKAPSLSHEAQVMRGASAAMDDGRGGGNRGQDAR